MPHEHKNRISLLFLEEKHISNNYHPLKKRYRKKRKNMIRLAV